MKRQMVQIPAEQVQKLLEIKEIRKDLIGFPLSKVVHLLLQERMAEIFVERPIPKKQAGKWFEYIREFAPMHVYAPIAIGVVRNSQEMIGYPFTRIFVGLDNNRMWWGTWKEDIYNIGEFLLAKFKDKQFAKQHTAKHQQWYEKMSHEAERIIHQDLTLLSKTELFTLYSNFYENYKKWHALVFDIDAIDIVLEQKLRENISPAEYNILTTPSTPSFVSMEKKEVHRVASLVQKTPALLKIFQLDTDRILQKLPTEIVAQLDRLVARYWWTQLSWASSKIKTKEQYITEIKELLRTPNLAAETQRLENEPAQLAMQKKNIKHDPYLLSIFEIYALFHDYRKEIQMKVTLAMNHILMETARRTGTKYDDIAWCWPDEIQQLIRSGSIDLEPIKKRRESFAFLVKETTIQQFSGIEAAQMIKQEFSVELENSGNFQGTIASPGKIVGPAKICYSAQEAKDKIKEGDVLVTSMTMPEFVPAMKKAAAIVTNEGGITCHAAIISRELRIPCIVGTSIATKTLNDGDIIEVNANHGVVKIVKRVS